MKIDALLSQLQSVAGAPAQRLTGELNYARRLSQTENEKYTDLLTAAAEKAMELVEKQGSLTFENVYAIEEMLAPMSKECKKYTWMLVGHAHIDMNWMWGYDETVSVVLDTFRTMLNLMQEHPDFVYAQSQASTYQIVEKYEPEMIGEIKAAIKRGQWEVSASHWVEPDHNMPNRASEIHHLLQTRRYLSKLLDIPESSLNLDFEPDTFGHNAGLPDVMSRAGVKYMYHCRGTRYESLYRWKGEAGSEILTMCDPGWYNAEIGPRWVERIPGFCTKYHVPVQLTPYGVGDHGGGPTRRDLFRIEDMMTWPIFPTVKYGSFKEYFSIIEKYADQLPVITGERNMMFTGCYTSQSRIKQGNAVSERHLYATEVFSTFANKHLSSADHTANITEAWEKVLFNHFHDILPGSGKRETREYAMGEFQRANALSTAARRSAYAAICKEINTSAFQCDIPAEDVAIGAGVGWGTGENHVSPVARGTGNVRVYQVFNPLPYARKANVEIMMWDPFDAPFTVTDGNGAELTFQVLASGWSTYWGHRYTQILASVPVPACGYATVVCTRKDPDCGPIPHEIPGWRTEDYFEMVLEHSRIRAEFDPLCGRVTRLIDKSTGKTVVTDAGFDLIQEAYMGMSSWNIGRYAQITSCTVKPQINKNLHGPLRQGYEVSASFGKASAIKYTVSLDEGDDKLVFDLNCDWHEMPVRDVSVPQLSFGAKLPEAQAEFTYSVQNGELVRKSMPMDVPALGAMAGGDAALMCSTRYGFRGDGDMMRVAVVHSSNDPDPVPEKGEVACRIALGLKSEKLGKAAEMFSTGCEAVSNSAHEGSLPLTASFLTVSENVTVSTVKAADDGKGVVVYLLNPADEAAEAVLTFKGDVKKAWECDYLENNEGELPVSGNTVAVTLPGRAVTAVKADLA